ncbi:SpoIIE family protein phosphatase [Bilophila wadsworthia]|uniref:SpoIIE family protein phosphatase n=3 Tax=Bilophila wadsworthia TaxID=35833 RepID=UPI003AAD02E3
MLDKERRIGATRRGGRAPVATSPETNDDLSTKNKLVLLVAGSLILLAVGVGLFSMYSVKRTMLEEQRRSSVNTVALATFNVMDRYQILFRSKADQAVALQHNLSWLAKLITTLVHDPSERFKIMQNFPLPEGISLMAIDPSGEIKLVRGDLEKDDNPYLLRDIKDRPVGPTMRALAEKGLPATCFVQWDAGGKKQRLYGTHLYLPGEGGLLVGLWANIDKLDEHQQRLKEDSIRELQNEFGKQRIGPSGFLFVTDSKGIPVIGPEGMNTTLSGINPKTGNTLIADIRNASKTPENPVEASIQSLIKRAPSRDALLFVRHVKPFDWYVTGVVYTDEASAPGKQLSFLLIAAILAATLFILPVALLMVTRLTSPLAKLGDYARKLPEQDFMEDARPTPLLAALADGKHGGEIASLANSLMFMDKTLRSRVRELMEATSSRERLEGELSAATEIQMGFLPKPLPPDVAAGRFSLAASLVPAREVGGDLYDFFMLDDRHLCFIIGDVSDKGVPASLFMSMTLTLIRSRAGSHPSPEHLMAEVNENLARDNAKCMFVTLFIGVLDLDTGELLYANGGHNPPLRLGDDGVAWLKGISGPVVGAMEGMNYTLLRTVVRPGETLFLYTDGVNEAMNAEGDVYSNEAMFRALASSPSREPASVLRHMLDDVSVHVNGNTASDDMTILCVRYFGGKR